MSAGDRRAGIGGGAARLIAAALALLAATPAHADRALLIGVGDYPNLPASLQLDAPDEDARRVASALEGAGFARDRITLMTARDGTVPTRAAVLAALDGLARQVSRGEQVLVYFSGHGAQAPTATPALEPDGLDELYLMHDASGWDGGQGRVPGAILDKEMAARIAAIRARGADVWFVADACHAGGAFRSGEAGLKVKAVGADALGIPQTRARPHRAVPAAAIADSDGRLAAFFAAGPGALAVERRLPLGSPEARPLSQFSFALTRAISAGRLRSLRDLAIAIEASGAGLGGGAPAPSFEGALDMPVLGLTADRPRRYPIERGARGALTIAAGIEDGLAAGDAVRIVGMDGAVAGRVVGTGLGASRIAASAPLPVGALEAERVLAPLNQGGEAALLAAIAPLAARGAAEQLHVTAELWRPGAARACRPLPAGPVRGAGAVSLLDLPVLGQCDVLIATVANRGDEAVDVSPLYFDASGAVTGLGFVGGGSARLEPGDSRRVAIRALVEDKAGRPLATGTERLALIALPAVTRTPRDLRGAVGASFRSGDTLPIDAGAGALSFRWRVGK